MSIDKLNNIFWTPPISREREGKAKQKKNEKKDKKKDQSKEKNDNGPGKINIRI